MTLSSSTGAEPNLSLKNFTGRSSAAKKTVVLASRPEIDDRDKAKAAPPPTPAADAAPPSFPEISADLFADLAIEFPVPSGEVVNNGVPAGIPLPPVYKPVVDRTHEEICGTLTEAAHTNDLPVPFFIRLLFQESRFKAGVVSSAGAQGIAQFMPATAAGMGLKNPFDPLQAIPASARLLRELMQQFGNLGLAAAAYNAGPKRIQDWLSKKGKLPQETQGYVQTITGRKAENWTAASARHPEQKIPRRAPCQDAAGLLAWNGPDRIPLPTPSPHRVAAAFKIVKTAKSDSPPHAKVASEQPAARKHENKGKASHKLEKVAQR